MLVIISQIVSLHLVLSSTRWVENVLLSTEIVILRVAWDIDSDSIHIQVEYSHEVKWFGNTREKIQLYSKVLFCIVICPPICVVLVISPVRGIINHVASLLWEIIFGNGAIEISFWGYIFPVR